MSNKTKNAALTMAGLATVFAAGQTVANAATYTVQKGDTLSEIASKFNVSIDDLVKKNNITDKNLIFTTQKIEVSSDDVKSDVATKASSQQAAQAAANTVATSVAKQQPAAKHAEEPKQVAQAKPVATASVEKAQPASEEPATVAQTTDAKPAAAAASGSTHDQFIANGGTEAMWQTIVQPESGGNPNAVSSNGYQGLGQTKEAWGTGSVADQTKGMVNYANSRYGSVENAIAFRQANGWW
ncbi:LysM repeat protein [Weissella uvarum]|uniref:LysM peptidoglycan-binding domain-containing protein n=1 Tax=Weissella uvarum TaxID=1479233 RepID=UPI00195F320A|nr:LysM peptidoglycan-binding domain-containing protein [Weissella uvarum]MBM7617124.1 LysM repeat protein [Weissella uvarum]MCM0595420.1 LysM peptidoglycan-binding domain-containing protein [Weissella uvarum]